MPVSPNGDFPCGHPPQVPARPDRKQGLSSEAPCRIQPIPPMGPQAFGSFRDSTGQEQGCPSQLLGCPLPCPPRAHTPCLPY